VQTQPAFFISQIFEPFINPEMYSILAGEIVLSKLKTKEGG